MTAKVFRTGQVHCYDGSGVEIPCRNSGQDGEDRRGEPWPPRRFREPAEGLVLDTMTGLTWAQDANPLEWPRSWEEALSAISEMNAEARLGRNDWRIPGRRELRSLLSHQETRPPLPPENPFRNVFPGWYWTATTVATRKRYAWRVHLGGGRTFYGEKGDYSLVWPVAGNGAVSIPDTQGIRFVPKGETVLDLKTGLTWRRRASVPDGELRWAEALSAVKTIGGEEGSGRWRLPNIAELESLVDLGSFGPALPEDHPFEDAGDVYWSSTTSTYEPGWAWALYLHKGAVGVGRKDYARFRVWPLLVEED